MEKHKTNTTARQQQQQQEEQQLAQQRQQEQELQRQLEQQLEQQQQEQQQRMILEHLQKGSSSSSPTPGDMSPIGTGIPVLVKNVINNNNNNNNDEHNQQQPRYGSFTLEVTEEGAPMEAPGSGGGPKVSSPYANSYILTHPLTSHHPHNQHKLTISLHSLISLSLCRPSIA